MIIICLLGVSIQILENIREEALLIDLLDNSTCPNRNLFEEISRLRISTIQNIHLSEYICSADTRNCGIATLAIFVSTIRTIINLVITLWRHQTRYVQTFFSFIFHSFFTRSSSHLFFFVFVCLFSVLFFFSEFCFCILRDNCPKLFRLFGCFICCVLKIQTNW